MFVKEVTRTTRKQKEFGKVQRETGFVVPILNTEMTAVM